MIQFRASKAIIHKGNKFLLQLRDNNPKIPCYNQWSFFGGALSQNELPWNGLQRELYEELEWSPPSGTYLFQCILNPKTNYINYFFSVPFLDKNQHLILHEGQDMSWFTYHKIISCSQMADHVLKIIARFKNIKKNAE